MIYFSMTRPSKVSHGRMFLIQFHHLVELMEIGPKPLSFIPGTPKTIRGNYFLDKGLWNKRPSSRPDDKFLLVLET